MCTPECRDAGRPVSLEYEKVGKHVDVSGIDVYITGEGTNAVLFCPDIFGLEFNQVFQVADRIADAGFVVAVPNVFGEGGPWPMSDFPPSDSGKFMDWINSMPQEQVAGKLDTVRQHLSATAGTNSYGVAGFCWGASISLFMGKDTYKAVACCHPAFFGKERELAAATNAPVCILPAEGDTDLAEAKEELAKKDFADKCVFKRFDDQVHGFLAARGDYSKPEVAAAAGEGIAVLVEFFKSCMA